MPRYEVYRFEPIPQGEITIDETTELSRLTAVLITAGMLSDRLRNVILNCDYADGKVILYDPTTKPATPLLLIKRPAPVSEQNTSNEGRSE
jgi:hypothetical protein